MTSLVGQHVKIRLWKNLTNEKLSVYNPVTTKSGAKQIPMKDLLNFHS